MSVPNIYERNPNPEITNLNILVNSSTGNELYKHLYHELKRIFARVGTTDSFIRDTASQLCRSLNTQTWHDVSIPPYINKPANYTDILVVTETSGGKPFAAKYDGCGFYNENGVLYGIKYWTYMPKAPCTKE